MKTAKAVIADWFEKAWGGEPMPSLRSMEEGHAASILYALAEAGYVVVPLLERTAFRLQSLERQLEEAKGEAIDNYDSWQYAEKVLSATQEKLEAAEAGANRREAFWQKHYDDRNRELSATQENLEAAERELELLKADPIHKWIEEANAKLQSAEASLAASEREKEMLRQALGNIAQAYAEPINLNRSLATEMFAIATSAIAALNRTRQAEQEGKTG